MAQLPNTANTGDNKEGMSDFTPIAAGKYPMLIKKSQFLATKAKTGHFLEMTLVITEGPQKGRTLIERLNLDNPNPAAVEIANKTLNTICQACDKVGVQDSEELHGIVMTCTVKLKPATATQPASNSIGFYEKYTGSIPTEKTSVPDTDAGMKSEGKKKLPWEKD